VKGRFSALLLMVTISAGHALAQVRAGGELLADGAPDDVPTSTSPASTTVSIRGTIETYDAPTRTVTLSTPKGVVRFVLAAIVRIRRDGQVVDASKLQTSAGYRAVVRYSQSGRLKTVESVHVFGRARR
jgi:hypothetical protein